MCEALFVQQTKYVMLVVKRSARIDIANQQ